MQIVYGSSAQKQVLCLGELVSAVPQAGSSVSFPGGGLCAHPSLLQPFSLGRILIGRELQCISRGLQVLEEKGHRVAQHSGKQSLGSSVEMPGCSAARMGLTRAMKQPRFGL